MVWTLPKTWSNEPLIAGDMNLHIRDNLEALKNPSSAIYEAVEGTDLSLNSTSWADVDATPGKFEQTITTYGGEIMVMLNGPVGVSGNLVLFLDVSVDGTAYGVTTLGAADGLYAQLIVNSTTIDGTVMFLRYLKNIPAGSHTFRLRYKVNVNTLTLYRGAGTLGADVAPEFFVREVS